jgi:hypothetical protein
LRIERADDDAPVLGGHDDMAELPIVLWDGNVSTLPHASSPFGEAGALAPRAALGVTATGRILVARGSFASAAPLAQALARAGCVRALLLDRGLHATAFLDRAGTASPPRAGYEESVLYAVGSPLRPRGFAFPSR